MGPRLVKKMAKIFFSEPGYQRYRGDNLHHRGLFIQSVWIVRKPEVSTSKICMVVPGHLTPAWSGRTVMGWRLVKKMAKIFCSEPGCQKYRGGVTRRHHGVFPIRVDRWKA